MIVKDNLEILKGIPNVLNLPSSVISSQEIKSAIQGIRNILEVSEARINHFTKPVIYKKLLEKNPKIKVLFMDSYFLPVSYNKKSNDVIINLKFFGTDDVSRIGYKDLYSLLVYGYAFRDLVTETFVIPRKYSTLYSQFIVNIMIKLFGKDYGLLGTFSTEISKLKFLTNCYVQCSFFGEKQDTSLYNLCSNISGYSYKTDEEFDPSKFDFTKIKDYIESLDKSRCMPGFDIYKFTSKMLRQFGYSFLPVFEDISRFQCIFTCSDLFGTRISPGYIRGFNEPTFKAIITISELMFRKMK